MEARQTYYTGVRAPNINFAIFVIRPIVCSQFELQVIRVKCPGVFDKARPNGPLVFLVQNWILQCVVRPNDPASGVRSSQVTSTSRNATE
jgi:hypothetical protein